MRQGVLIYDMKTDGWASVSVQMVTMVVCIVDKQWMCS